MTRARTKFLTFLLAIFTLFLTLNVKIYSADIPGDPIAWDPTDKFAFICQATLDKVPTQLKKVVYNDDYSIRFEDIGDTSANIIYNALAYNTDDNFLYAIVKDALGVTNPAGLKEGDIIKIGQNGYVQKVASLSGFPAGNSPAEANAGCYDPVNKIYYVWRDNIGGDAIYSNLFGINLDPASGTVGEVKVKIKLDKKSSAQDFTFYEGYLWGMKNNGNNQASLIQVDPSTGTVTEIKIPNLVLTANDKEQFGAAWTLGNGELMFSNNTSGNVYRINVSVDANGVASINRVMRHSGPSNDSNDGANMLGVVPPEPPPPEPPVCTKSVSDSDELNSTSVILSANSEPFVYRMSFNFGNDMANWDKAIIMDDLSTMAVDNVNVSSVIMFIPNTAKIYDEAGNDMLSKGAFTTDNDLKIEFTLNKDANTNDYSYLNEQTYILEVMAQIRSDATDENLSVFINNGGIPNQGTLIVYDALGNLEQNVNTNETTVMPMVLPKTGEDYYSFFEYLEIVNNPVLSFLENSIAKALKNYIF